MAAPKTSAPAKLYRQLQLKSRRKTVRRKAVRAGLLVSNVIVLLVIAGFVLKTPQSDSSQAASTVNSSVSAASTNNPLDQVSSADIALTVARMSSLPETTAVTNQAQTQAADVAVATTNDNVVSKPQVVATALKSSADISTYKVVEGDTIPSLSQKFGVTSDSIRWSNSLTGDSLTAGTMLSIPPVNGIVYTVQAGDTVDMLAGKFNANKEKIVGFNDTEIKGLVPGSKVIIPDGTKAVPITAAQIARTSTASTTSFPWGGSAIYGYNGYDYGYCTWYVANKISVPSNWGNARTWDDLAPSSGWTVNRQPVAGSIGVSNSGYFGHVAYVEAVSDDGTMIKYSDMNGLAGFGRVGYSDWVSSAKFNDYISR